MKRRPIVKLVLAVTAFGAGARGSYSFACQDLDGDGFYYEVDCGTLRDCNDASASIHPGAPEICDGHDNDCDGQLDDAPACDTSCDLPDPGETLSATAAGPAQFGPPSLVWTGSAYGVAWHRGQEIHFGRRDGWGHAIGTDLQLLAMSDSGQPSLVWTGSHYGIAWSDDRDGNAEIYFARIDATGDRIGADVRVTDGPFPSERPSLVWTGKEYAVSWSEYDAGSPSRAIRFTRIDADGNPSGSELEITNTNEAFGSHQDLSMIWTGSEYGVAWNRYESGSNSEIYFARLDAMGNKIGTDVRVTEWTLFSADPSLVWTGSEYAVAWADSRDGSHEIYFARLDAAGQKIGSDVRLTNAVWTSLRPSLVWNGSEYGVTWQDERTTATRIYFARIDAEGNKIGSDLQVTSAEQINSGSPSAVWTGSHYGLSWLRSIGGFPSYLLETARVGCDCFSDSDLDGFSVCHDCDDTDPTVFPGAFEICDGVNNDCRDPSWPSSLDHADRDLDGLSLCDGDCDDSRDDVFPGAPQLCDGINNDCDDPDWPAVSAYEISGDGDSFSECEGDCDDSTSSTRPGAVESCNRIDDDCDGIVDNIGGADTDRDGASDSCDNCLLERNPSQADRDLDGEGDLCDLADGLIYILFRQKGHLEWQAESGFDTWNSYRGDLERLHQDGSVSCTQDPARVPLARKDCDLPTPWVADDDPPPGAAVFFLVTGNATGSGIESGLGVDSFGVERPNRFPCP